MESAASGALEQSVSPVVILFYYIIGFFTCQLFFLYFSRWKIEKYFRRKKQMFQFENFRTRILKTINALNFHITLCMAFLNQISLKSETNALKVAIIRTANPVKEK